MSWICKFKNTLTVVIVFLCANLLALTLKLPSYGTWMGNRPLEQRLNKLEEFAKNGPVDAVVLGPSIADFGFSAELYSLLMTQKLGRPYRVFNFSTGAAELSFMPALYRLVRTVSNPKSIFLVMPVQGRQYEVMTIGSPDYALKNSPLGPYIDNSWLLRLSKLVWSLPIPAKSAAFRDLLIYGKFKNLHPEGADNYAVTFYGDRISYAAGGESLETMEKQLPERMKAIIPLPVDYEVDTHEAQSFYFANIAIKAMSELRDMANADQAKLYVFAHAPAVIIWGGSKADKSYLKGRAQFFEVLTSQLGAILINPLDDLALPDFAILDTSHLNIHGASAYTEAAFKYATVGLEVKQNLASLASTESASLAPIRSRDPQFTLMSSIIVRERGEQNKIIRCRFVDNFAVPKLPDSNLYFAIRMPNDKDVLTPARKLQNGEYEAVVDIGRSEKRQALILRLLYGKDGRAINAPLEKCEWVHR